MLRIQHSGAVLGPILIDDIDDGLPNKTAHRLYGDPKTYARDGYANVVKQRCYIKPGGRIDLHETNRVTLSAAKGKIAGLKAAGFITVATIDPATVVAPKLNTAVLSAGTLTLNGTTFLSVAPDVTTVTITGSGAKTLTADQIVAGSGTISATKIEIPVALIPGVVVTTSSVKVQANTKYSLPVVVTA